MTAATTEPDKFQTWAIVEVIGHKVFAGLLSEAQIAGQGFIRVDVPETGPHQPGFTKYIGPNSIYCITPTDEDTARVMAIRLTTPAIPATMARLISADREDGW